MAIKEEYIMVINKSLLDKTGSFQGINFEIEKYIAIIKDNHEYMERSEAETNYNFKQIIPYVILHCKGSIFSYYRGKLLNEARLEGKYSIGVGGHISIEDRNLFTPSFYEAMHREVREEVKINSDFKDKAVAIINDDSNEVGRVHLGIVYVFDLSEPNVNKKEKSINKSEFLTINDIRQKLKLYESWSKICIEEIEKILKVVGYPNI